MIEFAVIAPELDIAHEGACGYATWIVTVYDNDVNTFEEVASVLIQATGCSPTEAYEETWEVHNLGKSVVHQGAEADCDSVGKIIATIGIRVEISQE